MRLLTAMIAALAALLAVPATAQDDPIAKAVAAMSEFNNDDAKAILDPACKGGNAEACWRLALITANEYTDGSSAAADRQFLANCARGDARSCYMAAKRTDDSADAKDAAKNTARKRTALGKACDGGLAYACTDLAQDLAYDDSGKTDQKVLGTLYEKACTGGSRDGCHSAAQLYGQEYENPLQDYPRAVAFELKACDMGLADACGNVPSRERNVLGSDTEPTLAQRQRWQGFLQKACGLGDTDRCQEYLNATVDLP